jgi:hypothetical protein
MTAILWAVWSTLWGFLKKLPWQVWAVISVAVALYAGYLWVDHRGYARGKAAAEAVAAANERERVRLQKRADDIAQDALDGLAASLIQQQLDREAELQAAEERRLDDLAKLKGKAHVTPVEAARCPDVPRSYLLFRAAAAAYANGADDPAPAAAGAIPSDAPSGVSLAPVDGAPAVGPVLSETDTGQAGAYRVCAERNKAWLKYKADVDAYSLEVTRILKGDSP